MSDLTAQKKCGFFCQVYEIAANVNLKSEFWSPRSLLSRFSRKQFGLVLFVILYLCIAISETSGRTIIILGFVLQRFHYIFVSLMADSMFTNNFYLLSGRHDFIYFISNVGHGEWLFFAATLSFPPNMTVTWFMADSSDSVTARDPALPCALLTGCRHAVSFELDQTRLKTNQLISSRWKWKDVIIHNWPLFFALHDFCSVLGDVHSELREKDENNFVFRLKMITGDVWQFFFSPFA